MAEVGAISDGGLAIIPIGAGKLVIGTLTDVQTANSTVTLSGISKVDWCWAQCSNAVRAMQISIDSTSANKMNVVAETNDDDGYFMAVCDMGHGLSEGQFWILQPWPNKKKMSIGMIQECSDSGSTVDTGLINVEACFAVNRSDAAMVLAAAHATRGKATFTVDTDTDSIFWFAVGD